MTQICTLSLFLINSKSFLAVRIRRTVIHHDLLLKCNDPGIKSQTLLTYYDRFAFWQSVAMHSGRRPGPFSESPRFRRALCK
ncbi:hypothetical protein GDO78_022572 [Eleutherodactylus coqui]|uniref:Uncharacterized protein n=1 Tax=Eleutherodactylus coqui TaxID=57060 RepID=A0A8J6BDC2_ELECQ|nr:hypothetical protein GDO78_022572 [Eleutherodactylus coqui]